MHAVVVPRQDRLTSWLIADAMRSRQLALRLGFDMSILSGNRRAKAHPPPLQDDLSQDRNETDTTNRELRVIMRSSYMARHTTQGEQR